MKSVFMIAAFAMVLSALTREECSGMLERFDAVELAYDAAVLSKVAAPATVEAITRFRKEGKYIYNTCKDKMSTTRWYMLGKKVNDSKADIAKFRLESVSELTRYAITHPPVIIKNLCGTIRQGIHLPPK